MTRLVLALVLATALGACSFNVTKAPFAGHVVDPARNTESGADAAAL